MDKDEELIYDDLEEEMVSPIGDEYIEEQPVEDVPSNSNGGSFGETAQTLYNHQKNKKNEAQNNKMQPSPNSLKSSQDFQKNNKSTIDRLNDVKTKGQGLNKGNIAGQAGKEIGNKLAGKSEEEKGKLEKATDDIGGKAAGTAITAATGGAISGPAAEALGNVAYQLAKKELKRKLKMYAIITGAFAFIVLMFILIIASSESDEQETSTGELNSYMNGNMTEEELEEYLIYIGVCTEDGENYTLSDEDEKTINTADCKYAKQYFRKINSTYDDFKKDCTSGITISKQIDNPCSVELNIPLLHETLSYGKTNDELWNKKSSPDQEDDIEDLSNAMVEYVHESCYVMVKEYRTPDRQYVTNECNGCTFVREYKNPQDWYYFQLSFDKYVSFLRYGETSTHPYYQGKQPVLFGENHDHECVGPANSEFDFSTGSSSGLYTGSSSSESNVNTVVCEKWSGNQSLCNVTYCDWNSSTKACTSK